MKPRPAARTSHASCIDCTLQNKMYVYGGSGINIGSENMSDLWELSLNTFEFEEVRQSQSKNQAT